MPFGLTNAPSTFQRLMCHIFREFLQIFLEIYWLSSGQVSVVNHLEKLRKALIDAPILRAPDWNKVFHVHIYASNFAIGCVLAQLGEHNMDFLVSYASRQLNSAERYYTTTEREGLGMVYAVKKYRGSWSIVHQQRILSKWEYLEPGQIDNSRVSVKSSEESVHNLYHSLDPILEEDSLSDSTSTMSMNMSASGVPEFSMAFNMRLAFVRVNEHGAQLYKDPMNRWTVKVEDNPTTFDAAPWVNKPETPPFEDTEMQKLLNTLRVHLIHIDDPNITLYVYKTTETQNCYFTKNPDPSTIHNEKMSYVFVDGLLSMAVAPLYVDKYGIRYELMEQRAAQGLTWQGLPIPELAPGSGSSIGAGVISPQRSKSRKPGRSEKPAPSAPPMPMHQAATFNWDRMGFEANLESFRPTFQTPTVQTGLPHGDMSAQFFERQLFNQRRVRPSDFQKWVKKFNGTGDPYDHLAIFEQTARPEHVTDLHTLVEGFGLTLEGRALTWFQSLNTSKYQSFSALRKDFIAAFSKTGLKNDALSLVYGFKQDPKETVRDCASRLRQYMTRCPIDKLPTQERLVSIFQESLLNKELHAALFMKSHKVLEDCILDAIKYDDNCSKDGTGTGMSSSSTSTSTPSTQADQIIQGVVEKMQKLYAPPRMGEHRQAERPYICGLCGGNHPTSHCALKNAGPQQLRTEMPAQWCDFHKRWENHNTENCFDRINHLRGHAVGQANNLGMRGDRAMLVLEQQPPLPKAALVCIVDLQEDNIERALIPVTSYGDEQVSTSGYEESPYWDKTEDLPELLHVDHKLPGDLVTTVEAWTIRRKIAQTQDNRGMSIKPRHYQYSRDIV
ncbi:hypothetical protein L7F22_014188 [Adiantum nelumboides]|nr:hypothetical protein [Adiantum nelumboides]